MHAFLRSVLFSAFVALALGTATAQETPAPTPMSTTGVDVLAQDMKLPEVKALDLQLQPLTMDELLVEVEAWRDLVKAKVVQLNEGGGTDVALVEQRTQLLDRMRTAIDAYRLKGGDPTEFETYMSAVSGLQLSFDDTSALQNTLQAVVAWLQSAEGGIRWGLNILKFIVTLIAFRILSRILGGIVRKAMSRAKHASQLLKDFFANTVRNIVFLVGLVVALSMLEVNIAPLVAGIGALGFIIGFALQGTLGNFAAGIMILLYRPYEIGQVVSAAGVTGKVQSMNLVSTSLLTPDNQTVVVPNGSIWGGVITNITGNATRRVDLVFGIGYGDDIAKAESALMELVTSDPRVLKDPEPAIKVHELADSSVNFVVRPWVKTADYWDVYWDLTRKVKEKFDAEGISIPFPQQDVYMHQVESAS